MNKKLLRAIIGGLIGLIVGGLVCGFFGLVLGGTFLGGFDIYKQTGFEGYELSAYIGLIVGIIVGIILGVKIALRTYKEKLKKL